MVLYSQKMRETAVHIAEDTRYVELSSDIQFNELFMNEMDFPMPSDD